MRVSSSVGGATKPLIDSAAGAAAMAKPVAKRRSARDVVARNRRRRRLGGEGAVVDNGVVDVGVMIVAGCSSRSLAKVLNPLFSSATDEGAISRDSYTLPFTIPRRSTSPGDSGLEAW